MRRAWIAFRLALGCLTVVPVAVSPEDTEANLPASRFAYPLVGALLGLVLFALSEDLSRRSVNGPVAAFVLVIAGVGITGCLHLDGVADLFDGLFIRGTAENRLAVMRDPHVGVFGTVAIVLVLVGKFTALGLLSGHDRGFGLAASCIVGRSLILGCAGFVPYARAEGTGRFLIEATRPLDAVFALAVALGAAFGLMRGLGLKAFFVALLVGTAITVIARRRLGGITGDVLGAVVELGEMSFLLTLC
jgi:adenosylcobinamide-GDP ribazoletransferase